MSDDPLERPLTALEIRLVHQIGDAIEAALGGRDARLMLEVAAYLIADLLLDHAVKTRADAEECEAQTWHLIGHLMGRVNDLGVEANAGLLGAAVPAGHA
jgi:hypothetical protein